MPVMTTPPTITDRSDAAELSVSHGNIEFDHIRFAYKSGRPVIDDLSLTVRAGEKVGLGGYQVREKRRWSICSCVSMTFRRAPFASTGRIFARSRR